MQPDDEVVEFLSDESPSAATDDAGESWKLLVVDDDEEVHDATGFALHGMRLCGRRLQLIHARSAAEAAAVMVGDSEIAVILLDVVMESPDAGLRLVRRIRQDLHQAEVRIVLRTGQPGQAPELEVIRDYDINDYKTKAELTQTRLVTTLIAAIRSYEQLRAINDNRRGLELIVNTAAGLMETHALGAFAKLVLARLASLLHVAGDGVVCAPHTLPYADRDDEVAYVVAGSGELAGRTGMAIEQLRETEVASAILHCLSHRANAFGPRHVVLYLHGRKHEAAVYMRLNKPLTEIDHQLAEVFAANVSTCFGNVKLLERLSFVAYHDPLTGLPNRARFLLDLGAAGAVAKPDHVVCLLDLDRFTDINNALGHPVGDQLLVAVAKRLAVRCCNSRLARIGADSFGLVGALAELAPERLAALMEAPFVAGEQVLQLTATLGYCRIASRATGDTLFKHADMALTQARLNANTHYVFFEPQMEEHTFWRLDVIRQLRHDFANRQLAVWYQPQLLRDGGYSLEALARWPGVDDFLHPPSVFIRLAEDSGLIIEIGGWVLGQSCATYARLRDAGQAPRRMAVNVSMPQFRQPDFTERVLHTLVEYDMPPPTLELEITESILIDEPLVVMQNIEALRRAGVVITVDDFGTG
ncbi:MAG TPA: DUF3369 domain-containing protein, partial [Rhodocyclaceae bacterium]|nr:DUF3369 domain-containing protein [Rhodocyclaceae bacterium]